MEKFIKAAGVALRISVKGEGPEAVLLLHGYLESLDVWDDFSDLLASRYKVIAMDIPGHGISEVKGEEHSMEMLGDVAAGVLEACGCKKAFVVGHSMGGYVALAMAQRHPEMIAGLVLFSSNANADSEEKKQQREREIRLIQEDKKDLLARITPQKGFAEANRERMKEKIEELSDQIMLTEEDGIIALLRGMIAREDRNEVLRTLKAPELFIFGRGDEYITPEVAQKIIEAHPQAEVAWLENSGHNGFLEEPERAAEILSDFIEKHR